MLLWPTGQSISGVCVRSGSTMLANLRATQVSLYLGAGGADLGGAGGRLPRLALRSARRNAEGAPEAHSASLLLLQNPTAEPIV